MLKVALLTLLLKINIRECQVLLSRIMHEDIVDIYVAYVSPCMSSV